MDLHPFGLAISIHFDDARKARAISPALRAFHCCGPDDCVILLADPAPPTRGQRYWRELKFLAGPFWDGKRYRPAHPVDRQRIRKAAVLGYSAQVGRSQCKIELAPTQIDYVYSRSHSVA